MTLAELAGGDMSISLVSKIERGRVRPSLATLELLAARLGVPTAELLGGPASRAGDADAALALARARAALTHDDAPAALEALAADRLAGDPLASALRAAALLELDRDDEALRAADAVVRGGLAGPNDPAAAEALVRALLVRADALARAGRLDDAQEAYGRALDLAPEDWADARADALLGLARLAERERSPSTARNFDRQALAQLSAAAAPARRAQALRRRAEALAA
ncbi:MAG TPA: helix-turn-helix domain-containing protein, partial [Chloroflexota bacterium]|nr:helix-turn-helix domain-containing protein [Chloroflexota bacterium]